MILTREVAAIQDGGKLWELFESCMRVFHSGAAACTDKHEFCCAAGEDDPRTDWVNVWSLTNKAAADSLLTVQEHERDVLVKVGTNCVTLLAYSALRDVRNALGPPAPSYDLTNYTSNCYSWQQGDSVALDDSTPNPVLLPNPLHTTTLLADCPMCARADGKKCALQPAAPRRFVAGAATSTASLRARPHGSPAPLSCWPRPSAALSPLLCTAARRPRRP